MQFKLGWVKNSPHVASFFKRLNNVLNSISDAFCIIDTDFYPVLVFWLFVGLILALVKGEYEYMKKI